MTLTQAGAYIVANGTDSGDHMTYTRTFTDGSDYRLKLSNLCWMGTDVWTGTANVYDMAARAITDVSGALLGSAKRGVTPGAYQCTGAFGTLRMGIIY